MTELASDAKYSIRDLRERAFLTQREMGERLGVGQQHISDWECEVYTPSLRYRKQIARLFKDIPAAFIRWPKEGWRSQGR
jgi:DNA-binding XRE family transcriptional regulator